MTPAGVVRGFELPNIPAGATLQVRGRELLYVAAVCICAAIGLSWSMGRDLNWDYFNYHAYSALLTQQDRLGQDFFAAGLQGYLNPLPLLPFALMLQAGWHSLLIASALASIQALSVVFLYLIARRVAANAARPRLAAAVMTALGAASVPFVSQLGSSFVDATIAPFVMAALVLLCGEQVSRRALFCAGLLAGAAMGLKWTNAPYAVGTLIAAGAVVPVLGRGRWAAVLLATAGLVIGFGLCYGWWGWRLFENFGSPVFPLFNAVFHAPDFPSQAAAYDRFLPQSIEGWMRLPFALAEHRSWIYTEVVAPDLRPAALVLLAVAFPLVRALRRDAAPSEAPRGPATVLAVFFGVSLIGWAFTSTNGRYASPLLLILGPLLFFTARALFAERVVLMGLLVGLVLQVTHAASAGSPRWAPNHWTRDWLPASVPEDLRAGPQLFVTIGRPSESYLAALVHNNSVFVNPIGMFSIPNGGPGWARFEQLRSRFAGRTQVVFAGGRLGSSKGAQVVNAIDSMIDRLGLVLDRSTCRAIAVNEPQEEIKAPLVSGSDDNRVRHLTSCSATLKPRGAPELAARRQQVAEILGAFEVRCPKYLAPAGVQVEGSSHLWTRAYEKFDVFLTVDFKSAEITYRQQHQIGSVLIGRISSWREDVARFRCALPRGGVRGIDTLG